MIRGRGFGVLGDMVVGVIGALFGSVIFDAAGINPYGLLGALIVASAGATLLVAAVRALKTI